MSVNCHHAEYYEEDNFGTLVYRYVPEVFMLNALLILPLKYSVKEWIFIDDLMLILRSLHQPIIITLLALLGIFYSYRGMKKGHNLLFRYIFVFFIFSFLQTFSRIIQALISPRYPLIWVSQFSIYSNFFLATGSLIVLTIGCYYAFKEK